MKTLIIIALILSVIALSISIYLIHNLKSVTINKEEPVQDSVWDDKTLYDSYGNTCLSWDDKTTYDSNGNKLNWVINVNGTAEQERLNSMREHEIKRFGKEQVEKWDKEIEQGLNRI